MSCTCMWLAKATNYTVTSLGELNQCSVKYRCEKPSLQLTLYNRKKCSNVGEPYVFVELLNET